MDSDIHFVRDLHGRLRILRRAPPASPQHIDVSDPAQIAHWCRELGCTWLELFSAIEHAGTSVAAVRAALREAKR